MAKLTCKVLVLSLINITQWTYIKGCSKMLKIDLKDQFNILGANKHSYQNL